MPCRPERAYSPLVRNHLQAERIVLPGGCILHRANQNRRRIGLPLGQVQRQRPVHADLRTLGRVAALGIIGRVDLVSGNVGERHKYVIKINGPAILADKALAHKIFTVGNNLQRPRAVCLSGYLRFRGGSFLGRCGFASGQQQRRNERGS